MNLILTMCGKYSRFTTEGYKIPKFLLPWGNHCILSEILQQMKGFSDIYLIANELKDFQPFMEIEHERLTISANISIKFGYAGAAKDQALLIKNMKTKVDQRPEYTISLTISEKVNKLDLFKFKQTTTNRQEIYDLINRLEEKINELA